MDLNYEVELAGEREELLERIVIDIRSTSWSCPAGWAEDGPGHEAGSTIVIEDGQELKLSPDALKQLAERSFGGLYKVIMKSPEHLAKPLLNYWMENLHEDKSQVILKCQGSYVWGMVGVEQSDLSGKMVLTSIRDALIEQGGGSLKVEPMHVERDQRELRKNANTFFPTQFYRVHLEGLEFTSGNEVIHPVLDIKFSDFAIGKFEIDFGINDGINHASALVRRKGKALVSRNYKSSLDAQEITNLVKSIAERLANYMDDVKGIFDGPATVPLLPKQRDDLYENLPRFRDCTEVFGERVVESLRENPPTNLLAVYKTIIAMAGEEKLSSQNKHEAFAGHILGLNPFEIE